MTKKKVNIEIPRSGAAAEVPSGDVNIVYNDVRIAGLSETVDATLKTGGTVVQHDIEVEYTKPEPQPLTIPVYTLVAGENPTFAKNISATAGEAISDETIPIPNNVDIETTPTCVFQPGVNLFLYGNTEYTRNNTIKIRCYMPNRLPNDADKLVIIMEPRSK